MAENKKPPLSLDTEFLDLDLSVRVLNRLRELGLKTVGDVSSYTIDDWAKLKLSVRQQLLLLLELEKFGIRLKM